MKYKYCDKIHVSNSTVNILATNRIGVEVLFFA